MFKSQYHVEDLIYSTFHNTPNKSDVFIEKSTKNNPDRKT